MLDNILTDKSNKPDNQKLSAALGASYKYWEEIKSSLEGEYGRLTEEWKFYGQKIGWSLKLLYKKRNLFFFTPCDKYFRVSFVFGDKAVSAVEQTDLPKNIVYELKNAKKYAEGRGIRIEVRKKSDVNTIKKLAAIKIDN